MGRYCHTSWAEATLPCSTLTKMETSPPKHSVSLFSLPRLPALSCCSQHLLLVLHGCVNSDCVCSFKITFSSISFRHLQILSSAKSSFVLCTQLCLSQQGAQERHAFKIRGAVLFLQGEANPISVIKLIWRRWVFCSRTNRWKFLLSVQHYGREDLAL